MGNYSVTIELTEVERAAIDSVRGDEPIEEYIHDLALIGSGVRVVDGEVLLDSSEDLTPADHIRQANEAEANAVELDEAERIIWENFERRRAELQAEIKR
jgi:hypothetical protein